MLEFLRDVISKLPLWLFKAILTTASIGGFLRFVFGIQTVKELRSKLKDIWEEKLEPIWEENFHVIRSSFLWICGIFLISLFLIVTIPKIVSAIGNYNTIHVGVILPLTGTMNSIGLQMKNGMDLAIKKINSSGGINGHKLELLVTDGMSDNSHAISASQFLIEKHVPLVIVGLPSSTVLAVSPLFEENKIVLLSLISSSSEVSQAGNYIFRICADDKLEANALADYASKNFNHIAIIKTQGIVNSSFQDSFLKNLRPEIINPLNLFSIDQYDIDFKTILNKLKTDQVDAILIISYNRSQILQFLKQVNEINLNSVILTTSVIDGFVSPNLVLNYRSSKYIFASSIPFKQDSAIGMTKFINNYIKNYSINPSWFASISYNGTLLLQNVLSKTEKNFSAIKDSLYSMGTFEGIGWPIRFDLNGDNIANPTFIYQGDKDSLLTLSVYRP
jgi:branched-chain amino acid transport system substrate-binding protein